MSYTSRTNQAGLTLIEISIALVLSAVVVGGAIQIFLSGQQSYRLQKGLSTVQDNGRLAVFFLQRGLRMAGFPRTVEPGPPHRVNIVPSAAFEFDDDDSDLPATRDGQGANDPDFVTVVYQSATNCLGDDTSLYPAAQLMPGTSAGVFYTKDQYHIGTSRLAEAESRANPLSLRCRALGADNQQIGGRTVALVDGIEDLQILYGVDTFNETSGALTMSPDDPRDFKADAFINATAVRNRNLQGNIVSVRFAVLASSVNNALDEDSDRRFQLLDAPLRPADNDRALRRTFSSLVEVRNLTP